MDVYEAIAQRMTIRDFSDRQIDADLINKLISSGLQAPSNNHLREWHFVILQDRGKRMELLEQVIHPVSRRGANGIINRMGMKDSLQREMYLDAIPKQQAMLLNCACLVMPFYHQYSPLLTPKTLSDMNSFASIWCCIENILVAAASEGIFGVTRIPFEAERQIIKHFVSAPDGYEMPCYLALGYPAEGALRAAQLPIRIEERIHTDTW
jgi:nitroreductase